MAKKYFILSFKILGVLALLLVLAFCGLLIHGTATDYQPPESEDCAVVSSGEEVLPDTLRMVIWNIGYSGLGKEMDFFYDGGKNVRPSPEYSTLFLEGILRTTKNMEGYDFLLFQEVDTSSKRSYGRNIYKEIDGMMKDHNATFAMNYHTDFNPIPFSDPLGRINSGLATYSKYTPTAVTRHQFPGNYAWPKKVYMLDRCFMESRFPLANGKELVLINTHNSAYDDGTLKTQQMEYLKDFLITDYEAGNYVIVGGDWNQCPPNFNPHKFDGQTNDAYAQTNIDPEFMPAGWVWAYDPGFPTNRKLDKPYNAQESGRTLIDFYLVSPNVRVLEVKCRPQGFSYSDHEPVSLKITLQ